MSRRNYDHIHKYRKLVYGKGVIYKCAIPNCSHFVYPALLLGRESICWKCGKSFIIDRANTRLSPSYMTEKPICCRGSEATSTLVTTSGLTEEDMMAIIAEKEE